MLDAAIFDSDAFNKQMGWAWYTLAEIEHELAFKSQSKLLNALLRLCTIWNLCHDKTSFYTNVVSILFCGKLFADEFD
jgi:hypothetical protein